MTIDNILSPIPKDKDTKIGPDIELPLDNGLYVIRKAARAVSYHRLNGIDPNRGEIQVLFPGPVLRYERTDQAIVASVWQHGGNEEKAKRLHYYLKVHARLI